MFFLLSLYVRVLQNWVLKKVILISSDKAVRPTNIMGASKRICELIFQSYAENEKKKEAIKTIFSMVKIWKCDWFFRICSAAF